VADGRATAHAAVAGTVREVVDPAETVPGCTFCRAVRGELHVHLVAEDEATVAFLDHRPIFHGHVLLVPRPHHETLPDLPVELVGPLFQRVRGLAVAVRDAMGAQGTFVAVNNKVSQSVPHLHVHVVPRTKGDGLRGFFWPRTRYDSDARAAEVAARIAAELGRPGRSRG
jgi:histidine triad (HIT) family protein